MLTVATFIIGLGGAYVLTGAVVSVAYVVFQIDRRDPAARGTFAFRPLLLPGLILLWPLVMARWNRDRDAPSSISFQRIHKPAHRLIWMGLPIFLVVIMIAAWSLRQHTIPASPSIRIGQSLGVAP